MPKCSFCKKQYDLPHGLTLVLNDGTKLELCSSKCRKSWAMGRKGKKLRWIKKMKHTRAEQLAELKEEAAEEAEKQPEKKQDKKPEKKVEKKTPKEKEGK